MFLVATGEAASPMPGSPAKDHSASAPAVPASPDIMGSLQRSIACGARRVFQSMLPDGNCYSCGKLCAACDLSRQRCVVNSKVQDGSGVTVCRGCEAVNREYRSVRLQGERRDTARYKDCPYAKHNSHGDGQMQRLRAHAAALAHRCLTTHAFIVVMLCCHALQCLSVYRIRTATAASSCASSPCS